ncbi:GNAT family N-acetyltransferase [Luteolibacter arcticus]|uniref:GNAT family N-acetyltransferase n=1 Tax=Luteolibacter arcticus TaxID=1581411 RepID=A0ABT3GCX6_9BACT|nr:GNAT family N-acetyltransferase [Luteolibacter arcticus]MCW1921482.1 GNAT family N-acetyltransferase [Luteolibacter arcticus]
MADQGDFRAVLQYVPQFRGKIFVVLIEAGLLPEPAIAETLLDLAAMEDVGVKLILGVLGGDLKDLYDWTLECEIMAARLTRPLGDPDAVEEAKAILSRGQTVVADASSNDPLDPQVVDFTLGIGAVKLIALLEEAILIDGEPVPAVSAADADELAASGTVTGAHLLKSAAEACRKGVPRVHVLNGRRQGVLIDELFSNEGVGTMIHADSYRDIRPLREEDIPELLGMIGRSVRRTKLVARTYEDILAKIGDYRVMAIDDNVVGCVALHEYPADHTAEVACLYVKLNHEGRGYGVDLVKHAEQMAREKGLPKVFALTTRAADFFENRVGYTLRGPEALPESRRHQLEESGRDSKIFEKRL